MSVPSQFNGSNLLETDLSSLTEKLESEMGYHHAPTTTPHTPESKGLILSAPPEAVLTFGIAACVGAVWLARVLPY